MGDLLLYRLEDEQAVSLGAGGTSGIAVQLRRCGQPLDGQSSFEIATLQGNTVFSSQQVEQVTWLHVRITFKAAHPVDATE